ncbi:hypothetical protein [Mycobacterium sp. UM_CSW]|uniref:hypothetical protein n=1 Tax=Mycobacterium sp. UM_CSW TaxID=1370119 RepID=UPI0003F89002|nr:hypothetical protein [Mycobacterium sp. UM_CSW]
MITPGRIGIWLEDDHRHRRCSSDQRGNIVELTLEGRALIKAAASPHVADVRRVLIDQMTPA